MTKTAVISARIDPHLKHSAEQIFKELGLTTTQAITLFYKQVQLQRGKGFVPILLKGGEYVKAVVQHLKGVPPQWN